LAKAPEAGRGGTALTNQPRFPPACRYDIALLYLDQADYDLALAVETYKADERWEREHPMNGNIKGKNKTRKVGGIGSTGRLG
jgi:hypothetical protein